MTHPFTEHAWWSALEAAVDRFGEDRRAFVAAGPEWESRLTFGTWLRASRTVATALAALGVSRGDRVAVAAAGSPLWPVLQTACSHLGAVLVPLNVRYRSDEIAHVRNVARPKVIFAVETRGANRTADLIDSVESEDNATVVTFDRGDVSFNAAASAVVAQVDRRIDWPTFLALGEGPTPPPVGGPHDPVLLQFTSGTTAFPKAAMLTSTATLGVAFHLAERMGLTKDDVMFGTQPMYHVGGSVGTSLVPLTTGCSVVVPERYTPEEVFRLVPAHACTARTGQGAMYAMEFAHPDYSPYHFSTVERGWAAGTPELIRRVATDMGIRHIVAIYGLTESSSTTTAGLWSDDLEARATSCGRALPGLEVAIAEGVSGAITSESDQTGEVCVRGWAVMAGYLGDPTATAEAIDSEGWLHTGDLGFLDRHGHLHFVDRLKDMIKPGGENVSPAEIERVISGFPGIERVVVVGRADARLGEVPVAFVQGPVDPEHLLAYCAERMASFKVPRQVVLVDSWPMTESGKVRRHVLGAQLPPVEPGLVGRSG